MALKQIEKAEKQIDTMGTEGGSPKDLLPHV